MTHPTILAVDDLPDNLFVLCELIGEHLPDCRVVTALSAEEALEIARTRPVDAAVVDVHMPGVDGVELVRRLKADETTARIPVLLLTADARALRRLTEGLEAGADDFLTKPVDAIELVARVRVLLRMKRAEDDLRAANARLQETVAQRTAALEESDLQLQHAQKMEIVGRLAAGVAHDFNNLLTVIAGHAELLLMTLADDDPSKEDAQEIFAAAERAGRLSYQLLAFSRREAGHARVLSLNALVDQAHRMMRRVIGEDVELVCRTAAHLDRVEIDPVAVEQIVVNLLVNARDAMPDGGRVVVATDTAPAREDATPSAGRGAFVRLRVEDSGCGMDADTLRRAFDPFFTTKTTGKGTGLGLAIVKGIAERAGGFVEVHSEPQAGTSVSVFLPLSGRGVSDEGSPLGESAKGEGETVLLVEDDPSVRRVTARLLREHGYRVRTAATGEDASDEMDESSGDVDLLLTDLVLPTECGVRLAERLQARQPHLAVLYMSGHGPEMLEGRGAGAASERCVRKPFTTEGLLREVRVALDAARGRPGAV